MKDLVELMKSCNIASEFHSCVLITPNLVLTSTILFFLIYQIVSGIIHYIFIIILNPYNVRHS
jgi:hypothetical protein